MGIGRMVHLLLFTPIHSAQRMAAVIHNSIFSTYFGNLYIKDVCKQLSNVLLPQFTTQAFFFLPHII